MASYLPKRERKITIKTEMMRHDEAEKKIEIISRRASCSVSRHPFSDIANPGPRKCRCSKPISVNIKQENNFDGRIASSTIISDTNVTLATQNFGNETRGKPMSPIVMPNLPPKKTTLAKKVKTEAKRYDNCASPFLFYMPFHLYEYIDDIIYEMWQNDSKFVQKRNFLNDHNPNTEIRSHLLSWIIHLQEELLLNLEMYTIAVRMLDNILAILPVPKSMQKILVLAIVWIVTKCYGVTFLRAPELIKLCGDKTTTHELLWMERKVLKIFDSNIIMNDPVTFASYFLAKMGVPSENPVKHCVDYIIESFTLSPKFSIFSTSKVAAAALHLSLRVTKGTISYRSLETLARFYHPPENFREITTLMILHLKDIHNPRSDVVEPFRKYSGLESKKASIIVMQALI